MVCPLGHSKIILTEKPLIHLLILLILTKHLSIILNGKCQLLCFSEFSKTTVDGEPQLCGCEMQGMGLYIKSKPLYMHITYKKYENSSNIISIAETPSGKYVGSHLPPLTLVSMPSRSVRVLLLLSLRAETSGCSVLNTQVSDFHVDPVK